VGRGSAADRIGVGEGSARHRRRIYPWGNIWDGTHLNFCDKNCTYFWKENAVDDGYATTSPVGRYANGGSPHGAMDMAGNIWEWVNTWFKRISRQHVPVGMV